MKRASPARRRPRAPIVPLRIAVVWGALVCGCGASLAWAEGTGGDVGGPVAPPGGRRASEPVPPPVTPVLPEPPRAENVPNDVALVPPDVAAPESHPRTATEPDGGERSAPGAAGDGLPAPERARPNPGGRGVVGVSGPSSLDGGVDGSSPSPSPGPGGSLPTKSAALRAPATTRPPPRPLPRAPTSPPRDPSEVSIQLQVEPPGVAHVFWGVKDLGVAPLEVVRPRGSGPLDLEVRAPNYLTFHTRAFTEHDEKIAIRMVPQAEAPRFPGYRQSEGGTKAAAAPRSPPRPAVGRTTSAPPAKSNSVAPHRSK